MQTVKENNNQSLPQPFDSENPLNSDILVELGNIGAGNATTALADMINERIVVEVPRVHVSPPHLIPRLFPSRDELMTVIYMQLRGKADCDILLVLEVNEAKEIASMMSMMPIEELDQETENSALEELGNIMIGGFLSAISDFTGVKMVPHPPSLVRGLFDSVLDSFLVKQALLTEAALVFDACFRRTSSEIGGSLVVFPSEELQELLVTQSQEWLR